MAVKEVITELEKSLEKLMEEHRTMATLCAKLTAERDALKAERQALEQRVKSLDKELQHEQLTRGLAGGKEDKQKARARVNRLMREVDKCIALLSKPM